MGRATLFLPMALLFLASVIPSKAQKTEAVSAGAGEESRLTVAVGAPLTVECRLRPEQRAEWRRDGAAPPPDLRVAPEAAAGERLAARLQAAAAGAHHAGLYTCSRERDHRVRVVVLPAARAAETASVAAPAPASPPAATEDPPELLYDVRGNLSLHCSLPNDFSGAYVWTKNGTALDAVWELAGRVVLERGGAELRLARALEDDFGNYSCALAGREGRQSWAVRGRPHVKLPANTNAVEGQKLKLVCKVIGKPYRPVTWSYSNSSSEEGNFTEATLALGSRVALSESEQGVSGAVLQLEAAARSDAGRFRCSAPAAAAPATTVLRVKDMYAALWPFLGICAEVFVLCAIILVYEKRRTKPELDDSDTDNHDQKKS